MSDFRELLGRFELPTRVRHALIVGDFQISIQASSAHYSSPREDSPDPRDFDQWEMAIIPTSGEGPWLGRSALKALGICDEITCRFEDGCNPVGGFIPTADVQALVDFFRNRGGGAL